MALLILTPRAWHEVLPLRCQPYEGGDLHAVSGTNDFRAADFLP
jgi:hypothetical protein